MAAILKLKRMFMFISHECLEYKVSQDINEICKKMRSMRKNIQTDGKSKWRTVELKQRPVLTPSKKGYGMFVCYSL